MTIINKDYSLLWCGQLASQLGNRIYLMALAWYFVAVLGNGSGLFMLFMVSALPPLLFGVAIGPMVERWNKRHTVITCDILSGILVGILATAVMTGNAHEWLVYVVCFLLNTVNLFFSPSINVMLPSIVGKAKEVAEALKQELTDTIRELKVGQKMNFIREFTVKVVALGALPRNTTSGKIKKLIDKRVL